MKITRQNNQGKAHLGLHCPLRSRLSSWDQRKPGPQRYGFLPESYPSHLGPGWHLSGMPSGLASQMRRSTAKDTGLLPGSRSSTGQCDWPRYAETLPRMEGNADAARINITISFSPLLCFTVVCVFYITSSTYRIKCLQMARLSGSALQPS